MSLENLGKLKHLIELIRKSISSPDKIGDALGEVLNSIDKFKNMDATKLAKMLNILGLGSGNIRKTLTSIRKEAKDVDNAISTITSSGTKSMLGLGDVFTGLGETFKKWFSDLKDGAFQAGKSIATFLTSPVGIATAGLVATIGIGLYAIKQEYDKSFDGLSETLNTFRENTQQTESEITNAQETLAQNLSRIAELKTQDSTIDNTKEIENLERENSLLAAQIAYRESLLRIQEEAEAKAARDAYNVSYDSHVASEGEVKYDAISGQVYSTEVIEERTIAESYQGDLDLLEDLRRQYDETAKASSALIRKRTILEAQGLTNSEEWKTLNSDIEKYANDMEDLQGKILEVERSAVDKKGEILELYESCFRFDGSIVDGYEDLVAAIESLFPELGGVDSIIDSAIESYKEKLSHVFADESFIEENVTALENWFNALSDEDKELVYEIFLNYDTAGWALSQWDSALQRSKGESVEAVEEVQNKVEDFAESTEEFITEISAVQSALTSQATGASLSLEAFNSDDLKDYTFALEYNNGALQLNADKVNELIAAKAEEQISHIETQKALDQTTYLENAAKIERLRKKLQEKNFAQDESSESIQTTIDELLAENKTLKNQCTQYDLMSASLREATGAYQHWINAQSAAQTGDMFDDTIDAFNHINDTLNNKDSELYGRVGRTDYEAAVNLVIPDSIDPKDTKAVNKYMKEIYNLFTYDDDGNYAGLNIKNFCKRAVNEGLMVLDKATNSYQIVGQQTMEDFAEGMSLSLPLVQAMFGEMEEFGAEFSWADEAHQSFGDLAVSANEAAEALRGFEGNENLEIRLDVSDIEDGQEKLDTLDLTIAEMNTIKAKPNVDPSEVEYANEVIKYCVAQKQLLSQPDVMMVDTSVVEGDLGNAIALLQEFQTAKNNLEVAQALGLDTTQAQADLDAATQKIQNLDANITSEKVLNIDTTSIDTISDSLKDLSAELIVKAGVDETAVIG